MVSSTHEVPPFVDDLSMLRNSRLVELDTMIGTVVFIFGSAGETDKKLKLFVECPWRLKLPDQGVVTGSDDFITAISKDNSTEDERFEFESRIASLLRLISYESGRVAGQGFIALDASVSLHGDLTIRFENQVTLQVLPAGVLNFQWILHDGNAAVAVFPRSEQFQRSLAPNTVAGSEQ